MMEKQFNRPFRLMAADLSLRHSGFALLTVNPRQKRVDVEEVIDIDNFRYHGMPYGFLFQRISEAITELSEHAEMFVREAVYLDDTQSCKVLSAVEGISTLALWTARNTSFEFIPATLVKKLVTGYGKSTKEQVAECLPWYVGNQQYTCLDQSDAVAVGVAWLIRNGYIESQVEPRTVYGSNYCPCLPLYCPSAQPIGSIMI